MSTTNPQTSTNATTREINEHLDQWESGVERLEGELRHIKQESQKEYSDQIAVLQQQLKELRLRLQALDRGEPHEWQESRSAYHQRLVRFRQAFVQTGQSLHNENEVALGWLQGFTDERTNESAGWAEGMGHRPEGSEGWVEGMGHRPEGSKGWAEGYDEVNKD